MRKGSFPLLAFLSPPYLAKNNQKHRLTQVLFPFLPLMKRFLLSLLSASFLLTPTLASFSPELLEQISSEVLRDKTLRQDAEPVLHQLQSQYQHCASSHPKPEVRKTCQDFLNQQFPRLAQQWAGVQTGGFRIDFLGKLSPQERYARMGRKHNMQIHLENQNWLPTDKYEYSVINFPEL